MSDNMKTVGSPSSGGKYARGTTPQVPFTISEQAGQLVSPMDGELTEAILADRCFYAATQGTGKITTVDLATTYTGLCLYNPAGSGKKLKLRAFNATVAVAGAALIAVYLAGGWSAAGIVTHTTPLVWGTAMGSLLLGSTSTGVAGADDACTLVNPRHLMPLGIVGATPGSQPQIFQNASGGPVIKPGGWVAFTTNIVTGAAGLFASFWWEEVDL